MQSLEHDMENTKVNNSTCFNDEIGKDLLIAGCKTGPFKYKHVKNGPIKKLAIDPISEPVQNNHFALTPVNLNQTRHKKNNTCFQFEEQLSIGVDTKADS